MSIGTEGLADPQLEAALARGETLPGSWFTDDHIFELELERIFHRTWQYVGLTSRIPEPGDFFTWRLGRVPIVVVRTETGEVNALVNVCAHRGSEVVAEACGSRKTLQCPYHAWTYNLDGSLKNAPRTERNPQFDPSGLELERLPTHTFGPFVFVNPDPDAAPFEESFESWTALVENAGVDLDQVLHLHEEKRSEIASNWKVMCENNFECYHCPTNHPSLKLIQDVHEDLWYDMHDTFFNYGPHELEDGAAEKSEEFYGTDGEERQASLLNFLWPNFWFALVPGTAVVLLQIQPLAAGRSVYVRQYCFAKHVTEQERVETLAFWEQVLGEDEALTVGVQRGLDSGRFERGSLLLPSTEPAIQVFESWAYRALTVER